METPNTRSRRKRELEASQEETSVVWGQDVQLLREFTIAGPAEVPIPLPSPTQRPRPITASSSTGPGTHPRKRTRIRSTSSMPPQEDTGKRLDELLERFIDISSRPGSRTPTPNTSSMATSSRKTASTSTSASTGTSARSGRIVRRPMSERSVNGATPLTATRSLPAKSTPASILTRRVASATDIGKLKDMEAKPVKDVKEVKGVKEVKEKVTKEKEPRLTPRPFRPPLLNRSSPRRPALRAPQDKDTGQPRRPSPRGVGAVAPQPKPTNMRPPARPCDIPSSDGDTSIDSFDGFLEGGSIEVDELFASLDAQGC